MSRSAFEVLLDSFASVWRRRKKHLLSSAHVLGLTLHWMNSTKAPMWSFSMTHGRVPYSLDIGIACLHTCLVTLPAARIELSDELRIQSFCSLINAKEPGFSNAFGFVDVLDSSLQNHWNYDIQNAYYNEWKCKCFASQVLVWGPDGCVIYAHFNTPGSWHDSRSTQDLYSRLLDLPGGDRLIVDSEFPKIGVVGACLLSSLKDDVSQELSESKYRAVLLMPSFEVSGKLLSGEMETCNQFLLGFSFHWPLNLEREDDFWNHAFECSISEPVFVDSLK